MLFNLFSIFIFSAVHLRLLFESPIGFCFQTPTDVNVYDNYELATLGLVKMLAQTVTEKLSETSRQGAGLVISVFDVQPLCTASLHVHSLPIIPFFSSVKP